MAAVPPGEVEPGQRALLAARQRELVAALVAGAEPPAGLDRDRVRVQAEALLRKRGRNVAHAQPGLAAALGTGFGRAFADYALGQAGRAGRAGRPGPPPDCAATDAVEFARYLRGAGGRPHPSADVRREARRVTRPWLSRLGYRLRR